MNTDEVVREQILAEELICELSVFSLYYLLIVNVNFALLLSKNCSSELWLEPLVNKMKLVFSPSSPTLEAC